MTQVGLRPLGPHGIVAAFVFSALGSLVGACGAQDGPGGEDATRFEAPAWVNNLGRTSAATGSTSGDDGTTPDFYGVVAEIDGVAEPLIVPESNVVVNTTNLRVLFAPGVADDGETQVSLSWTMLPTVQAPATLGLVLGPFPESNDEAVFAYSESATSGQANDVTAITRGQLKLERWSDSQINGTFSAAIHLRDGSARRIDDGLIRVRRDRVQEQ